MKHSEIPRITDSEWKSLSIPKLKKEAVEYYKKHYSGKHVLNIEKGVRIKFVNTGIKHSLNARPGIGYEKIIIIRRLSHMLKYAKFSSWQYPKPSHPKSTIGFMRFVAYAYVNGRKRRYTFDIRMDEAGNFYYDLNVYVKK